MLLPGTTNTDYFGNARAKTTANPADVGAVEYGVVTGTLVAANPNPLRFTDVVAGSGTATRDLTLSNNGTTTFTIPAQTFTAGFSRINNILVPGNCGATLAAGASCTIRVQWSPVPTTATATATASVAAGSITGIAVNTGGSLYTAAPTVLLVGGGGIGAAAHAVITGGAVTSIVVDLPGSGYTAAPVVVLSGGDRQIGTVTIAGVSGSPVPIMGNTVAVLARASVGPSPLAFGNWATGTTSNAYTLLVTNVGNVALAGGSYTFNIATPFTRATTAQGGAGTCGATLAVGASCTYNVVFAPTSVAAFSRTLTVAFTGATVEPTPVTLTGSGVGTRAAVSIAPLVITLPTGTITDDSAAVVTNNAPVGTGANLTVTGVTVSGGTLLTFFFNAVSGQNACTGKTLPPGGSCTVGVRFTNITSARGVNRPGTITVTSNGLPSPAIGSLTGFATP